jgi:hypothetical protein
MVGSRVQHPDAVAEEQSVEVVRNHKGGTWSSSADGGPKESPARGAPGVDSTIEHDGGAIFDNPKRGSPVFALGGRNRTASGKTAPKVMREMDFTACVAKSPPEDGPRSPHGRRESGRS